MQVVDVNVLVGLLIRDHPSHGAAVRWWERSVASDEPFAVPDLVWVGLVRIITNPRVLRAPLTFEVAWGAASVLATDPRYRSAGPRPQVMDAFARLAIESGARGNLVTDAYIAAVAVSLGASVVTFDRDFRRFDGVRLVEPA